MRKKIRVKKSFKILLCGSFKFWDEMNRLAQKLRKERFNCFLPKFALGNSPSSEIERMKGKKKQNNLKDEEFEKIVRVKNRFYKKLKEADILIIFNKDGYVGLSVAAEIGAAHILGKPTLFLKEPGDVGVRALLRFSPNFKVVPLENIINEIKNIREKIK